LYGARTPEVAAIFGEVSTAQAQTRAGE